MTTLMLRVAALACAALALAAPATPAALSSRPVLPAGHGPQRLAADAALVAGSAGGALADLRLRDAAGREVPYLLVPPEAREGGWRPGRVLPVAATKASSGFELDLGRAVTTDRLRVEGLPQPFLKRCRVEGSGDRARWTVLVAEGTLFALPDEDLRQLEASFPAGDYRYLRVTWDDRMSARLPLPREVSVHLPPDGAPPPPATATVAFTRRASEPRVSRFRLRLPGPHLPVTALLLEVGGGLVSRDAAVLQADVRDGELAPAELGAVRLRRVQRGDVTAARLRIPVATPAELELELRVQDGDNGPLDLRGVRAELAPLPWIFFESPDGAPLTATYGDPAARAPQYDLEALRAELPRLHPADASWGAAETAAAAPIAAAAVGDPGPGGPVDRAPFRFARAVPVAPPGLAALVLDAHVLARSAAPGLGDLRIADGQGRQVQYLLERREEPLAAALALPAATSPERGVSRYALELPEAGLPSARLVLATSARVFERRVTVVEAEAPTPGERLRDRRHHDRDGGERVLASATWRHASPDEEAPPLVLDLPGAAGRRVVLAIDEGDNSPLPLRSAELLLPTFRLRFFHTGAPLTLLYGNPDAGRPRYDLALLQPRLRGAAAEELALGPVGAAPSHDGPALDTPRVFWIVLVVAVVALLAVLARLLRKPTPPAAG